MPPFLPPLPTPCAPNSTSRPARGLLHAIPHRNLKLPPGRRGGRITISSSSSTLSAAQDLIADAPTPRAFSALFKAASSATSPSPSLGVQLHAQAVVRGFLGDGDNSNTILSTAILNFYASCREPDLARQVFDAMARTNAVTWNALIKGYAQAGRREEALELFRDMRRQGHVAPDKYTFPALLSGIGRERGGGCMQELGGSMHAQVIKSGLHKDPFVGASLVSMYAAIGALEDVKVVFDDVDTLDPVVWSSMISAYVNCKEEQGALLTFYKMLCRDIKPRQFVYSSLFAICGSMSLLEMGRQVHAHSLKNIADKDAAMTNALLTMYSDCGCIDDAWRVFSSNDVVDVVSYSSMILALGQHGHPKEAFELFRQMEFSGLVPDEVTLLNLLSAFNHAGLVHEGLHIFDSMLDIQGIKPTYQHYACVIDMLARSGEIGEAIKTINEMPFEAGTPLWRIVLGACSKHRDIATGIKIAEMLFEMEPYEAANYILLGNIYTRLGRWTEAEKVRSVMDKRGIGSYDAFSWIEMGKKTHRFGVADRSHPISEEIYRNLDRLIGSIKAAGYVPDISFAAHNLEKDGREESLHYHCEKLAFAFGDLASPSGNTLRIMKNLRACGDCHSAYKYFSLITGRKIILRDNHRFHHFNNGACSCGDYW
ncbi:putative pentatricopeptide repeat-containing protein At5g52630 [Lolium perenne]|uniref:putative pentatricopeptide repeat-containing protein At5g52630 n=1 Tax=Lolium perenne TaxID=4522 RepID=UPI0021EADB4D|nr:pentatricopeptide repeat-containing protein At3g24000, mitochondrial-like [Lolium perenne]